MNPIRICSLLAITVSGLCVGCGPSSTPGAASSKPTGAVGDDSSLAELLKANGQDTNGIQPLEKSDVSSGGESFILHLANCKSRDPYPRAIDLLRTHVFVFSKDGKLLKEIGRNDAAYIGNYVMLLPLATKNHWFIWHSEFEESKSNQKQPNPFRATSDFYLVGNPVKLALRVYHYDVGDNTYTNTPEHLIGGLTPFIWFEGEKIVGENPNGQRPETKPVLDSRDKGEGMGRDGKMHQPKIEWDAATSRFRGPAQITVGDDVLYSVDVEASEAFDATDAPEDEN